MLPDTDPTELGNPFVDVLWIDQYSVFQRPSELQTLWVGGELIRDLGIHTK